MPLTPFWQFQQTCQGKMRKNEVQNFKRKFRNHDPESYQTNKGFNRNSATEMPGAPGAANSVEMSGSMYELDVVMIFLKVPCSCRNCLRSGSGCREQIHWCDTNAALPMWSPNSTICPSSNSASWGLSSCRVLQLWPGPYCDGHASTTKNKIPKFHSGTWRFKTFSEGIVYIGNSIRVPPLPEVWKVRRVEITSVTTLPHHGKILRAFRSEKLTKIIKTCTRAWKMNFKSRLIWSYPLPRLASTSSHIAPRQSTLFDKPWCRPPKLQELGQDLRWNGSNFNFFECNQCKLCNKHLPVLKDGSRI